jgi:hypothetical protein
MTLIPVQISFRGLDHSDALEADIRERVAWLEQFYGGIVRCRVRVEMPHRHQRIGRPFEVRIELTVPQGGPIVVNRQASLHATLKDLEEPRHQKAVDVDSVFKYGRVAVHEAFDDARRKLEDFAREQRGAVKAHEVQGAGGVP